jgi:hypothetical protein
VGVSDTVHISTGQLSLRELLRSSSTGFDCFKTVSVLDAVFDEALASMARLFIVRLIRCLPMRHGKTHQALHCYVEQIRLALQFYKSISAKLTSFMVTEELGIWREE